MGKPILYGVDRSPAVRTVLLTASAIDLEFEFREVDTAANEHLSEEFLRKNPQHTIPTLEDGCYCIWDSHAIAKYLIAKYAKDDFLYPKDLFTRAVIDQRLHFENGVLYPAARTMRLALKQNNSEQIEESRTKLLQIYDFLENFLGNNLYMVGDNLTVADFSIVTSLSTVHCFFPVDSSKFPKLNQWLIRMAELPYYQEANGNGLQSLIAFVHQQANANANKSSLCD